VKWIRTSRLLAGWLMRLPMLLAVVGVASCYFLLINQTTRTCKQANESISRLPSVALFWLLLLIEMLMTSAAWLLLLLLLFRFCCRCCCCGDARLLVKGSRRCRF